MRARRFATAALLLAACASTEETPKGSGCEDCHRPSDVPQGIEEPHAAYAVKCIECHGGNGDGKSIAEAHPADATQGKEIRELSLVAFRALDPAYRRFLNPSDLSNVTQSCGSGNGESCHQSIVDSVQRSVHATAAGILNIPRYNAGLNRERGPVKASVAATDSTWTSQAPRGTAAMVEAIEPVATGSAAAMPAQGNAKRLLEHALGRACTGCHINVYGGKGEYRTGNDFGIGCGACHMPYAPTGFGESKDPSLNRTQGAHPIRHELTRTVPDVQCEYCHYRSTRIGLQFRGIREPTIGDALSLPSSARKVAEPIHNQPADHYIEDDDAADTVDLTPPDIHHDKGLGCVDCHVGPDMHGDGHIHGNMGGNKGIECSDCHGTFDAKAAPDAMGVFHSTGGAALTRLRREADGRVVLRGALDGRDHPVTQIVDLRKTEALKKAHVTGNHGELECYACHTSWMQNVYLQRVTLDFREKSGDVLTGAQEDGKVIEENELMSLDNLHLGINSDGKIGTFMAYNIAFSVVVPCDPRTGGADCQNSASQPAFGRRVVTNYVGRTSEGRFGLSYIPVFAHTTATRATVQPCERCHKRQFDVVCGVGSNNDPECIDENTRVRIAFGFGSKRFGGTSRFTARLTDTSTAALVDLTRIADASGRAIAPFAVPGTGPVPADSVQRATNYRVLPPLR